MDAWSTKTGEWGQRPDERWAIPAREVVKKFSALAPNVLLRYEQDPDFPKPIMPAGTRLWLVDELETWAKTKCRRAPARKAWTPKQRAARESTRRQKAPAVEVIQ